MDVSFRRCLNLILAFVMQNISEDDWRKDWLPHFRFDPAVQRRMDERARGIKPASGDKRATIEFPKHRAKPYVDPRKITPDTDSEGQ